MLSNFILLLIAHYSSESLIESAGGALVSTGKTSIFGRKRKEAQLPPHSGAAFDFP